MVVQDLGYYGEEAKLNHRAFRCLIIILFLSLNDLYIGMMGSFCPYHVIHSIFVFLLQVIITYETFCQYKRIAMDVKKKRISNVGPVTNNDNSSCL